MINGKRVLALITARGGSKGLKGKNIKPLCGKPLLAWPIDAAKQSNYIDKIVVSTDCQKIADVAVKYGAELPFIRPDEIAQDTTTSFEVIEHALNQLTIRGEHFDILVLLEPTSPLTQTEDIDKALENLTENNVGAQAIVGVTDVEDSHPSFCLTVDKHGLIQSYQDEFKVTRRQDLTSVYRFEGSLYISQIPYLLTHETFYHQHTLPYFVPKWQAFEVDDLTDFICIEAIAKNLKSIRETGGEA